MKIFKIIGSMSGTSFDGIDLAYVETDGDKIMFFGLHKYYKFSEELIKKLKSAKNPNLEELLLLEKEITEFYSVSVKDFMKECKKKIDIIAFHGQTLYHEPARQITCQIGNSSLLAFNTNVSVYADLRKFDIAAGGQGAPIVPVFHKALANYLKLQLPTVFLNIGGVSNVTYVNQSNSFEGFDESNSLAVANDSLYKSKMAYILAFDAGPGNALIDDAMNKYFNKEYDDKGEIARSGLVDQSVLNAFLNDEYFTKPIPKSLDRNYWQGKIENLNLSPKDLIATLTEFTAMAIAKAYDHFPVKPETLIVCGGGRKNTYLMERLNAILQVSISDINNLALNGDAIEAQAMAYIAARALNGMPYTFPTTTGAIRPVGGGAFYQPW